MASSSSFGFALLSGKLDIDSVPVYNLINLGRHVINSDVNMFK